MNIFDTRLVRIGLKVKDKNDALMTIARFYEKTGTVEDGTKFYAKLMEREKTLSTGIGHGIALPHLRDAMVRELKAGIYLLDREIDFDSLDKKCVKLIISFAIPSEGSNEYMKILQKVSGYLRDEENRKAVLVCRDRDTLLKIFRSLEQ